MNDHSFITDILSIFYFINFYNQEEKLKISKIDSLTSLKGQGSDLFMKPSFFAAGGNFLFKKEGEFHLRIQR
jgi:hypothetical protein